MAENWFDFSEHMPSVEWLKELPSGLVSQQVDLTHWAVTVDESEEGYQVYIGPIDPYKGGDGISIWIDRAGQLKAYEIERLAPINC